MNPDLPSRGWLPAPGWLSLDWFNRLVDDTDDAARSSLLDRDPEAVDADGHLIETLITVCFDGTITQILNRDGHHFGEDPLPALLFLAGQAAVAIIYSTEIELPDHTRGLVVFGT